MSTRYLPRLENKHVLLSEFLTSPFHSVILSICHPTESLVHFGMFPFQVEGKRHPLSETGSLGALLNALLSGPYT
jgi:hypothetical protein